MGLYVNPCTHPQPSFMPVYSGVAKPENPILWLATPRSQNETELAKVCVQTYLAMVYYVAATQLANRATKIDSQDAFVPPLLAKIRT